MTDVTSEQLELVREIVKVYGFKDLTDYATEVSSSSIKKDPDFYDNVSKYVSTIGSLFPTHDVNVSRLNGSITNVTTAMSILRSLLTYCGILWRTRRKDKTIAIRLIDKDTHMMIMTECEVQSSSKIQIEQVTQKAPYTTYTNCYETETDRRYNIHINVPVWKKGMKLCSLQLDEKFSNHKKVLECGSCYVYTTTQKEMIPESMRWLPWLKYHQYSVVICDLLKPMTEKDITVHYELTEPDEPEPPSAMLNCITPGCGPKCSLKDKVNFFMVMSDMGGLRYHCTCPGTGYKPYIMEKNVVYRIESSYHNVCPSQVVFASIPIKTMDTREIRNVPYRFKVISENVKVENCEPDANGWYNTSTSGWWCHVRNVNNEKIVYDIEQLDGVGKVAPPSDELLSLQKYLNGLDNSCK